MLRDMNLTIREFRVFRAVYELRSFSAAARGVHMTQSAVSKLCQEMEGKVGNRLFERSTRKVEPTSLADHLYGYACEILGTMDAAERTLGGLATLALGQLSVAASPMMMHGLMTGPVSEFHRQHPGVSLSLHELSTDETIDHVINGKADFGLVSIEHAHPKLRIESLYDETMHAVFGVGHPLAARKTITWKHVAAHPHISLHDTFSVRRTVDRIFAQRDSACASAIEVGSVLSVLGLVKAGLGIAILPGYITGFANEVGLATRRLPDTECAHPISLIYRWNARPSMAAERLVGMLKASLA
jgi:DNA-binding transcriptional LysR family regulator